MKKVLAVVVIVLVMVLIILLFPYLRNFNAETILQYSPQSPVVAALLLVGLYCSKNILMFLPVAALYVAAGMLFSLPWAILVTYIGLACEFTIGYFVGRAIGQKRVEELVLKRPKAESFVSMVQRNETTACFFSRVVPLPVPLDVMSMFYGATGVGYGKYIGLSMLGISAPMIPFVMAGESIENVLSAQFLVPFGIGLAITGTAFAVFVMMEKRQKKQAEAEHNSSSGF